MDPSRECVVRVRAKVLEKGGKVYGKRAPPMLLKSEDQSCASRSECRQGRIGVFSQLSFDFDRGARALFFSFSSSFVRALAIYTLDSERKKEKQSKFSSVTDRALASKDSRPRDFRS